MKRLFFALGLAVVASSSSWSLPPRVKQQADLAVELRRGPLAGWTKAFKRLDAAAFSLLCDEKTTVSAWTGRREPAKGFDGVKQSAWSPAPGALLGRAELAAAAAAYLADYAKIDDVAMTLTDLTWEPGEASATAEVEYDLRGRLKDGSLRTDRGTLDVSLRRDSASWNISKIADRGMETLEAKTPVFEDATAQLGFAGVERHARLEAIRRGGYALAVGDYDNSGWASIYVGGRGSGQLYGRGADGVYRDVTKAAGLGRDTLVKAAVFADFDGDGKLDLLVQRFIKGEEGKELKFYRNTGGGKFVEAHAALLRKAKHDRAMSMTAGDFNNDGLIDLYVGYPGTRDFTDTRLDAPDGLAHQAVYMNRGNWKFEEVDSAPLLSAEVVRPHSALTLDIAGDRRANILVVDDRGNSSRLYVNQAGAGGEGGERFKDGALHLGLQNQGWGMVAVAGDYTQEQRESIYFTNIGLSAGDLLVRLMEKAGADPKTDPGFARLKNLFGGNRLFRATGGGEFRTATEAAGVGRVGEAAAGAAWIDYDNDGFLDLYVANGLWSGDPERSYDDEFARAVVDGIRPEAGAPDNPVMARLQKTGESFGGHQRHRLFHNNGDGSFTEVGYVTGADRGEDGYVVATADTGKSGRTDLILRNADPSDLKYGALPITILRNTGANANKSLAVYPRDKAGAPVFGAQVTARVGDATQLRVIRSVEGAVQSEAMAFFGLGDRLRADSVEVRWPSGRVSRFEGVEAGRITVNEGDNEPGRLTRLSAAEPSGGK